ncbi:MAG: AI-2E family transporter [Solirubrobacteraceae bacterium]|nr:AI-2E family transporter [Solirubrobacteraceae bacterium]
MDFAPRPSHGRGWLVPASDRALRLLIIAAAILAAVYAASVLRVVVLPLMLALVMSTVLEPVAARLRERGASDALAAAIALIAGLAVLIGIIAAVIPPAVAEFGELDVGVSGGVDVVQTWIANGAFGFSGEQLQALFDDAEEEVRANAGQLSRGILSGAIVVAEVLTGLVLAVVLLFFFLKDGTSIWKWLVELAPAQHRRDVDALGQKTRTTLGGYLRGVTVVAIFDSVFIALSLILIGVPLVLPLALLVFIGAYIPIVGAVVAGLAAVLVALVAEGPFAALLVLAAVIAVQQVEGNFLQPVVVGRSVEMHPVVILLAVTAGAVLAGIMGALIATPVVAVCGAALRYWRFERSPEATLAGLGVNVELPSPGRHDFDVHRAARLVSA